MESKLLAAMIDSRDAYVTLTKLGVDNDLSQLAKQIYKRIQSYYGRDDNASFVDKDILLSALSREMPAHADKFKHALDNLPEVSTANVLDCLVNTRLSNLSIDMRACMDKGDTIKAAELMQEYITLSKEGITDSQDKSASYSVRNGVASSELLKVFGDGVAYNILPKELGEIIKGLIPGDHILIYASPEVGKSAVAINMAAGLCYQGKRVLYVGNEDPEERMLLRFKSRFSGMTVEQVSSHQQQADERASKYGYNNLFFVRLYPGTPQDVMNLCLQIKPDVCIVDQLVNLQFIGGKEPPKTELLERLAYIMRMFYSKHRILGISLSQADEKSIGREYLELRNVYYSNIGVQGQCDVMIGVGMTPAMEHHGHRCLNVVKNKACGEHTFIHVELDHKLSKLKTI